MTSDTVTDYWYRSQYFQKMLFCKYCSILSRCQHTKTLLSKPTRAKNDILQKSFHLLEYLWKTESDNKIGNKYKISRKTPRHVSVYVIDIVSFFTPPYILCHKLFYRFCHLCKVLFFSSR